MATKIVKVEGSDWVEVSGLKTDVFYRIDDASGGYVNYIIADLLPQEVVKGHFFKTTFSDNAPFKLTGDDKLYVRNDSSYSTSFLIDESSYGGSGTGGGGGGGITTELDPKSLHLSGAKTMLGELRMGNNKITSVRDATSDTDGVSLQDVKKFSKLIPYSVVTNTPDLSISSADKTLVENKKFVVAGLGGDRALDGTNIVTFVPGDIIYHDGNYGQLYLGDEKSLHINGDNSMTYILNMGDNRIENLANADADTDGVNLEDVKKYNKLIPYNVITNTPRLDIASGDKTLVENKKFIVTGGDGDRVLDGSTSHSYVNGDILYHDGNYGQLYLGDAQSLHISGDNQMQANLNVGDNRIENLADATSDTDATNLQDVKEYKKLHTLDIVGNNPDLTISNPDKTLVAYKRFVVTGGDGDIAFDGVNSLRYYNGDVIYHNGNYGELEVGDVHSLHIRGDNAMLNNLNMGSKRLVSLRDGVSGSDGATYKQLLSRTTFNGWSAISNFPDLSKGNTWKEPVEFRRYKVTTAGTYSLNGTDLVRYEIGDLLEHDGDYGKPYKFSYELVALDGTSEFEVPLPLTGQRIIELGSAVEDTDAVNKSDMVTYTYSQAQINSLISGGINIKGVWEADTAFPVDFTDKAASTIGDAYIVSKAGTTSVDGTNAWAVGDMALIYEVATVRHVDNIAGSANTFATLTGDPSDNANLQAALDLKINLDSSTPLTVAFNVHSQKVINLGRGSNPTDAATIGQVEEAINYISGNASAEHAYSSSPISLKYGGGTLATQGWLAYDLIYGDAWTRISDGTGGYTPPTTFYPQWVLDDYVINVIDTATSTLPFIYRYLYDTVVSGTLPDADADFESVVPILGTRSYQDIALMSLHGGSMHFGFSLTDNTIAAKMGVAWDGATSVGGDAFDPVAKVKTARGITGWDEIRSRFLIVINVDEAAFTVTYTVAMGVKTDSLLPPNVSNSAGDIFQQVHVETYADLAALDRFRNSFIDIHVTFVESCFEKFILEVDEVEVTPAGGMAWIRPMDLGSTTNNHTRNQFSIGSGSSGSTKSGCLVSNIYITPTRHNTYTLTADNFKTASSASFDVFSLTNVKGSTAVLIVPELLNVAVGSVMFIQNQFGSTAEFRGFGHTFNFKNAFWRTTDANIQLIYGGDKQWRVT